MDKKRQCYPASACNPNKQEWTSSLIPIYSQTKYEDKCFHIYYFDHSIIMPSNLSNQWSNSEIDNRNIANLSKTKKNK